MNATALIDSLDRFGRILPALVAGVPDDVIRRRPESGAWSILEIVMHLADEEQADFRPRLEITLRGGNEPWPPIDPEGWAVERRYNEADLADGLERFTTERRRSVDWLRGLDRPDWSRSYTHPKLGTLRAGDLLAAWAAHDTLHLRQIAKRMFELCAGGGGEFSTAYAGRW